MRLCVCVRAYIYIPIPAPCVWVCLPDEARSSSDSSGACSFWGVCVCLRVSWCVLIGASSRSMSLTGWITVISHYWLPISLLHTTSLLFCLSTFSVPSLSSTSYSFFLTALFYLQLCLSVLKSSSSCAFIYLFLCCLVAALSFLSPSVVLILPFLSCPS